jgi:hypothetical protein
VVPWFPAPALTASIACSFPALDQHPGNCFTFYWLFSCTQDILLEEVLEASVEFKASD